MVVQAPPPPSVTPDDGVIEDARRRQQRHRRRGAALLSAIAAAALIAGVAVGGGGSDAGGPASARPSTPGPRPGSAHAQASTGFAGAPSTQRDGYGVESNTCPLATPNRYLPPRAGCVFVRRVDMTGDGRRDLVIVYSLLGRRHPYWFDGPVPTEIAKNFVPLHAYVEVVLPSGARISARIAGGRGSDTAAIEFVTHVAGARGDELFLDVNQGSTGGTYAAYGLHDGHLIAAGVLLASGGDGAYGVRFNCLPGDPPRLATRTFVLIGPTINGWWRETRVVYAWRAARLVPVSRRTFRVRGAPRSDAAAFRNGCVSASGT